MIEQLRSEWEELGQLQRFLFVGLLVHVLALSTSLERVRMEIRYARSVR